MSVLRKHTRLALIALFGAAGGARAADPQSDARAIIQQMGDAVIATLRAGANKVQREATFREVYRRHFDNAGLAAWAAGRAFAAAAPAAQQEYLRVFENYIVKAYAAQLAKYRGERLRVERSEAEGQDIVVSSKLGDPDPRAMRELEFKWRMRRVGGRLLVIDVVVDKISMGLAEKRAFADWLREAGGSLEGLTAKLREKAAEVESHADRPPPQAPGPAVPQQ
jgi:phospholipid transport system substrate-binding protein